MKSYLEINAEHLNTITHAALSEEQPTPLYIFILISVARYQK